MLGREFRSELRCEMWHAAGPPKSNNNDIVSNKTSTPPVPGNDGVKEIVNLPQDHTKTHRVHQL